MLGDHKAEDVQRDFLKFTSQQILKVLRNEKSNAKDRKHQVWERNAFSMPVYESRFLFQKLEYIHNNPVVAGYCKHPEDYYFSSASFYLKGDANLDFSNMLMDERAVLVVRSRVGEEHQHGRVAERLRD